MKVSTSLVTFRIDVDFEGCEVDMVLKEMSARGVTTSVPSILTDGAKIPINETYLPLTPTEASVDFCLHWLSGFVDKRQMCTSNYKSSEITELEKLGVDVVNFYGLMQGTCHLNCEVEYDKYNSELVEKCQEIVNKTFKKFIQFYK